MASKKSNLILEIRVNMAHRMTPAEAFALTSGYHHKTIAELVERRQYEHTEHPVALAAACRKFQQAGDAKTAAARHANTDAPNLDGRYMYFVDPGFLVEGKGYRPSIIVEGVAGHYPNGQADGVEPWYWGFDLTVAKEIARQRNERLGLTPEDESAILASCLG